MQDNYLKRSQYFTVALDEVDYREHLKPSAVMQYFQDLATSHAKDLGIGFEAMKEQNLYWIMSRLSYRIDSYPDVGDKIIVTTYPEAPRMAEANRSFFIHNEKGSIIARGRSKWCVVDIDTKRIKRCDVLFNFPKESYIPEPALENGTAKIDIIEVSKDIVKEFLHDVKITDLDRNDHMNNARYGDAVLNSCDKNIVDNQCIETFDINFLSELKFNERFNIKTFPINNETFFDASKPDGSAAFRAKIGWRS